MDDVVDSGSDPGGMMSHHEALLEVQMVAYALPGWAESFREVGDEAVAARLCRFAGRLLVAGPLAGSAYNALFTRWLTGVEQSSDNALRTALAMARAGTETGVP
jgi:hypothetical protein